MGLPKIIQITCHHVLANQKILKFKKGAPLKQFFNINLGIGIIKKTTFFVRIFYISPCVLNQILIGRVRWMQNLIPHPMSSPNQNLCHHHVFSGISCFWGSEVRQKYAEWLLVGCKI